MLSAILLKVISSFVANIEADNGPIVRDYKAF